LQAQAVPLDLRSNNSYCGRTTEQQLILRQNISLELTQGRCYNNIPNGRRDGLSSETDS